MNNTNPTQMTKHIFGMTKSSFDAKGAKEQKLRLDLLQLIHTINRLTQKGKHGHGCLLVTTDAMKTLAEKWKGKYTEQAMPNVEIVSLKDLGITITDDLLDEKAKNTSFENSNAPIAKKFMEQTLADYLNKQFNLGEPKPESEVMGIKWDYYAEHGNS